MAKIFINDKHEKSDGYGFNMIDNQRNVLIYYYNKPFLQVPDSIAVKFKDRVDLDIQYDDPALNKEKVETVVITNKPKLTKKQLINLNKNEQIEILNNLNYSGTIPKSESQRIDLILKLQG